MNTTTNAAQDTRFDKITDKNIRTAIERLYAFYDAEKLTEWFGSLYDPESGGFYYALSSRDHEGFLPDIESTYQITQMMGRGMLGKKSFMEFFGEELSAKIVSYYQNLQDEATGFFIHPQIGYEETMKHVMRYSRDLDWSVAMLKRFGSAPLYPLPYDRAAAAPKTETKQTAAVNAEGWEATEESVRAYVNKQLDTRNFEGWSNTLQTQLTAFKTTGMLNCVLDVLDERINPELGVWSKAKNEDGSYVDFLGRNEVAYGVYTGTFKIMIMYNNAGRPVPYALKMMENAIDCINSRKPGIRVTYLYNPWATLRELHTNIKSYGAAEELAVFDRTMSEHAVELIESTIVNLGDFRSADGSFSFVPGKSSAMIYGTHVSLGYPEGDVNGTLIGVAAMSHSVCSSLGYDIVPLFTEANGARLLEILKNAKPIVKKPVPAEN